MLFCQRCHLVEQLIISDKVYIITESILYRNVSYVTVSIELH